MFFFDAFCSTESIDHFFNKRIAQLVGLWENARRYILGMGFF